MSNNPTPNQEFEAKALPQHSNNTRSLNQHSQNTTNSQNQQPQIPRYAIKSLQGHANNISAMVPKLVSPAQSNQPKVTK